MTRIRAVAPSDLESILDMNQAARPAVGDLDPDRLAHVVAESSIALCVEDDRGLAGFCLVLGPDADYGSVNYGWFAARYDDFIYLDRVVVVPEQWGRGIGRSLYEEVERLAAERHPAATKFTLEVNLRPRNEASLRFHHRLGFREVGRQETPYGAEVSLMERPLRV